MRKIFILLVRLLTLLSLFLFSACTNISTLNLTPHRYGLVPVQIIWLQISGLLPEHLAMLRFSLPSSLDQTSFESSQCVGHTWRYNLYDLRPDAFSGFMSQVVGKKNIKGPGNCSDFRNTPIWRYLYENGYQSGIMEIGATKGDTLARALDCGKSEGSSFLKDTILWRMAAKEKKEELSFHAQEKETFKAGEVYYDKSCQQGGSCYTSIFRNVDFLFNDFIRDRDRIFFLVRDYTYAQALRKKNIESAREILMELERLYQNFLNYSARREVKGRVLLLITSTDPLNFEFPASGKTWASFERTGSPLLYHRPSLQGMVLATGARAENFCGFYEEAEIFRRIIEGPRGVEFRRW